MHAALVDFEKLTSGIVAVVDSERHSNQNFIENFPELATRVLEKIDFQFPAADLNSALTKWLTSTSPLPEQINVHNTFGEPPITLFNNGIYVVDLYIWVSCDTSIHSHGFRGAFKVLCGTSLHETYRVNLTEAIAHDVELTELTIAETELLRSGDVRTILPGRKLTHRVLHLENPTITLCLKTINEPTLSQWHHFAGGTSGDLAIQKRHLDQSLIKQIYFFQYLANKNGKRAEEFLNQILSIQDISVLMNLCEELASGAYPIKDEFVQLILEKISSRFEDTEWFQRYNESAALQTRDIQFGEFDSPHSRLATHFLNRGLGFKAAQTFFKNLSGPANCEEKIEFDLRDHVDSERLKQFFES